jgi:hypothetical protein
MLRKTSNFEKGKGERMKPDYVVHASFYIGRGDNHYIYIYMM